MNRTILFSFLNPLSCFLAATTCCSYILKKQLKREYIHTGLAFVLVLLLFFGAPIRGSANGENRAQMSERSGRGMESGAGGQGSRALILRGDNRTPKLKKATRSWKTNWDRRTIELYELKQGGPPRDGIPSIDRPMFVTPEEAREWLRDNEPLIFFEHNNDARGYPLQILIWHEIVNDTVGLLPVTVTFCPLCNSAIVFDRSIDGKVYEFGTSGLLRNSDLVMYDRTTETLWQQVTGEAIAGQLAGKALNLLPSSIVSFGDLKTSFPDAKILSRNTGHVREYGRNPYAGYDTIDQSPFLFDGELDNRLRPMERVVTVTLETERGGKIDIAYPYALLRERGVVNDTRGGVPLVLFYMPGTSSALNAPAIKDGIDVGASGVYSSRIGDTILTFTMNEGSIIDTNTTSSWNIFGVATQGQLRGTTLSPIIHGDHFWFAWAAFKPKTILYTLE